LSPASAPCRAARLCRRLAAAAALAAAFALGAGIPATATAARAGAIQPLDSLRTAAVRFVKHQLGKRASDAKVEAGNLDPRLRLAACDAPLESFAPPGTRTVGMTSVGVRCRGSRHWTVYVPVTVHVYGKVLVAARTLARGTVLRPDDLKAVRRDLSRLSPGYLTDRKHATGMVLLRPLGPGNLLVQSAVKPPRLVQRGQDVTILASVGGLVVRSQGKALADGAYGETVRVRNSRSRRIVQGVVSARGTVKVRM